MIKRDEYQPPADAIEALARCLLPGIHSYFESEEGQREFKEWQARQSQHTEKMSVVAEEKRAS
jgi:hypothetical protein